MLKAYLKRIFETSQNGDAREESYYDSLKLLFKDYADSVYKKNVHITMLPKKTEAGNPDFRIWDGKQNIVGYIEAKKPTEEDLDHIERSEQLQRYLHTFPNLILTNFFEFRLYRDGRLVDKAQIARPFIVNMLKTIPPLEKEEAFLSLMEKFFAFSLPKSYSAKTLAIELAKRTRFLKDQVIAEELKEESEKGSGDILGFYEAFQKYLINGLTKDDFADLYAQTITYGLFAARTRSKNGFNRKLAYDNIPPTIGILRDVFRFISLGDLPPSMEWIVDDISQVLAVADANQILHKYFHEGKGGDPIIHFYETFLAEYDPAERERRGVYYTPEPVVSYIVRSLHSILKEYFDRPDGFATTSVTVLDPAAGTLTFLAEASKLAIAEFRDKYGEGGKEAFIKDYILKNFYAFELMMAPYAVGHLKMSFLLEELGYKLKKEDRFKLYLTNTLEIEELEQSKLPGMSSLAEESHLAGKVKKETPILVVLGNPPYSGISANMGDWITSLIEDYKYVDGKHFGERKHWLQDDYVKFIRFAQWKIDQAGEGVLGFITNHGYLDNLTFRGMRQSLMGSFNEIYILDLHGSSLKKEKCLDGSKDENVFDIQQGVAIGLFFKNKERTECKIYHSEILGLREKKYDWLLVNDIKTTKWKKLNSISPSYFFIPTREKGREVYMNYLQVTDIFPINSLGIVTARDKFAIDFDKEGLKRRIIIFRNLSLPDEEIKQAFKLKDTSTFKLTKSRAACFKNEDWDKYFTKILYRPFDKRNIYYSKIVVERPLLEVMQHMMQENLGLMTTRQVNDDFKHALCSESIVDNCAVSLGTRERSYLFPLYLYPHADKKDLFSATEAKHKTPNINPAIFAALSKTYGKKPTPEEIFYYIYAVLYSNAYRTKYAEFLKTDFPRVPFTKNYKLFINMGKYGKELVELHLLKSPDLDHPIARFQGKGDNRVEKPRYIEGEQRVYINASQYFEGIEIEVWEYHIGGYQVLDKWLKDRKKRILSLDEIQHYCRVATALKRTIEIQEKVGNIYPEVEGEFLSVEYLQKPKV